MTSHLGAAVAEQPDRGGRIPGQVPLLRSTAPEAPDGRRAYLAVALILLGCICTLHFVHPDGLLGKGTYLLMTVSAGVTAWVGSRRRPRRSRFAWTCIAVAVAVSGIADTIYYVLIPGSSLSDVTVADGLWLGSYVVLAVGLSSLIVGGSALRPVDIDGLIDIGSFGILAVISATQVPVVRDIMADSSYSLSTRIVWTAYPVLDATVLGVVVQAMVRGKLRGRSGVLVTIGALLWLVSDFASLLAVGERTLGLLDVGWMLGAAALAVSVWPASTVGTSVRDVGVPRVTDARIFITLLPLLVPGGIAMYEFSRGREHNPVPLFAATLLLVMLAFARSARLVKARNRQEAVLERSTHFFSALAENSSDAVIVVDSAGQIMNDAPNLAAMLGRTGVATAGMDAIDLWRPADRDRARVAFDRWWMTSGVVVDAEVQATHADGSDRWFGLRATNLSADPIVGGMVINLRDITDRRRVEEELRHSAFHDSLTGLANRALLHDRLGHALDRTARTARSVAVICLDLDGFKTVNDNAGHEAGDVVLREVAARVAGVVRTPDTVARLGGDEFAILIEESDRALDEAVIIADRILHTLSTPFVVGADRFYMKASIGISAGDNSSTTSSMLRDADVAMYQSKTTGKGKWTVYEPAMRAAALQRLKLDADLYDALDRRQLRIVYQPVVHLASGALDGFEALLRWDHPTLGLIEPATFIPIAESNGTIITIGRWVLREACRTAAQWHHTSPHLNLTIAVNLSASQFAAPDLVEQVAEALTQSRLPPACLTLEMTETVLVQDPVTARHQLEQLRAHGVRLAIDDFGTGYSSLSYLRQFPIDILKIDKSFIDTIIDGSEIPPIVHGVLELAKTLRMQTIAEGIELPAQHESLRDQLCDLGQGFLFAKPLDLDEVTALLETLRAPEALSTSTVRTDP